jgi:hypothetical protein
VFEIELSKVLRWVVGKGRVGLPKEGYHAPKMFVTKNENAAPGVLEALSVANAGYTVKLERHGLTVLTPHRTQPVGDLPHSHVGFDALENPRHEVFGTLSAIFK